MQEQRIEFGLGIDISKDSFHVCLMKLDASGNPLIVGRRKFKQSVGGHTELYKWLLKYSLGQESPLQVVMEATGVYHESLLFDLFDKGFKVCLILAKQGKDYTRSLNQFSKNDQLDSKALAHLALHRRLQVWRPFFKDIYQIRSLMRHRRILVDERTVFKNRLHALKHAHCPSEAVLKATQALIEQLDLFIKQAETQAESLAKQDQKFFGKIQTILASLPGIGLVTLLEVLAETNAFAAFNSYKQLVRYTGYDVIENQSGKHQGKTKISKRGNARLRAAMYMPTLCVIRNKVEPFYGLFLRVLERNPGVKKKAQVAVQRKLLVLIYTLWKNGEMFDPEKQVQKHPKEQGEANKHNSLEQMHEKELSNPTQQQPQTEKEHHQETKKNQNQHNDDTNTLHTFDPEKRSSPSIKLELHGIGST